MISEQALVFNTYVLQPLAFILSGNLLKLITANVLAFVIGQANGTGAPQFVQDLRGNLQRVGDNQANAFFVQFGKNSNSPFASSISSSLRTNYLQNTSMAGFFAANRNTLGNYSPNVNRFLAGDWSQGGTAAWLALTTQPQNNPYMFYQRAQTQLASVVGSAQAARAAELNWGDGFLSWCGPAQEGQQEISEEKAALGIGETGTAPGDACTQKDGTPGTVKTPGSTIKASLDSTLGSTQRKLEGMGSLANEINGILKDVGTVMATVNFATNLLGGSDSGGLAGIGQSSGGGAVSPLTQYRTSAGYLGVTGSTVYQNASSLPSSGSDMLTRIADYQAAWTTIRSAANAASTTVASLATFCTTAAATSPNIANTATAEAIAAQSAITTQIVPVIAQANAADATIAAATAMVQKIQNELNSGVDTAGDAYLADLQTLQAMSPTTLDVSNAQQETQTFGTAVAIPTGSLAVSGGTIIDRMALLATNAEALKTSACTDQFSGSVYYNPGG